MNFILAMLMPLAIGPVSFAVGKANKDKGVAISSSTLEFSIGQVALTNEHREKIQELLREAPNRGSDMLLTVVGWSDQPHPAEARLSRDQVELADQRLNNVKDYIAETQYQGSIDEFNMAKRTSWLARLFNTDEREVKSLFTGRDTPDRALEHRFRAIKENGKAGNVVLVLSKDEGIL